MRYKLKTATLSLALMGTFACGALAANSALASGSPGGASAPDTPVAAPAPNAKVHPSGIATWFGPGFYGQKTACGQMLTPGVVGVANRTLPCGTLVKVTYATHSLTVPVLDRGPYSHGAEWDLTAGAAQALGITETVRIHARIVGHTANTPNLGVPATAPTAVLAGGALAG